MTKVGNLLSDKHEGLQPQEGHVALGRAEGKPADLLQALPTRGQSLLAEGKLLMLKNKDFGKHVMWKEHMNPQAEMSTSLQTFPHATEAGVPAW